jgi:hypothetical protein
MPNLPSPPGISAGRETATPYFLLRRAEFPEVLEAAAAWLGLPPDPLAA